MQKPLSVRQWQHATGSVSGFCLSFSFSKELGDLPFQVQALLVSQTVGAAGSVSCAVSAALVHTCRLCRRCILCIILRNVAFGAFIEKTERREEHTPPVFTFAVSERDVQRLVVPGRKSDIAVSLSGIYRTPSLA